MRTRPPRTPPSVLCIHTDTTTHHRPGSMVEENSNSVVHTAQSEGSAGAQGMWSLDRCGVDTRGVSQTALRVQQRSIACDCCCCYRGKTSSPLSERKRGSHEETFRLQACGIASIAWKESRSRVRRREVRQSPAILTSRGILSLCPLFQAQVLFSLAFPTPVGCCSSATNFPNGKVSRSLKRPRKGSERHHLPVDPCYFPESARNILCNPRPWITAGRPRPQ